MPDPKCTICKGTGRVQLFTSSSRCDCATDSVVPTQKIDNEFIGILDGRLSVNTDNSEEIVPTELEIEDAQAKIASMLKLEDFNRLDLLERSLEELEELGELIESHGDVFSKLVYHFGDVELAKTAIEEEYAGISNSLEDFAYELLGDMGTLAEIPENLHNYFDFEK